MERSKRMKPAGSKIRTEAASALLNLMREFSELTRNLKNLDSLIGVLQKKMPK